MTLLKLFEIGFPTALTYGYAALIASSSLSYAAAVSFHTRISAFAEILLDTMYVPLRIREHSGGGLLTRVRSLGFASVAGLT